MPMKTANPPFSSLSQALCALALIVAVLGFTARSHAAEPDDPVQLAYVGDEQMSVSINIVCNRERATVVFKNLGNRWTVPAMLSARHNATGKVVARAIAMKADQTASFQLPYRQSVGIVLGEVSAPWLSRNLQVKKDVSCG